MATSIRLLEKTIHPDGRITLMYSDNENLEFFTTIDLERFVDIGKLDRDVTEIMKRILAAWSHSNQDAVNRQCQFDALDTNRNVMRIRN